MGSVNNSVIAQVNIAELKYPLDDPRMAGFVDNIARINAIAEADPAFIWRYLGEMDSPAVLSAFGDGIIFNASVWRDIEALHAFSYRSAHADLIAQRKSWFHHSPQAYQALWWVDEGHAPTPAEARQRLDHLREHGPTPFAFTFKQRFSPEDLAKE